MRRVVTGHDREGKSIILSDEHPRRVSEFRNLPGLRFYEIWATDDNPQLPVSSDDPTVTMTQFIPPLGSTRFRVASFPPDSRVAELAAKGEIDFAELGREFATAMPDLATTLEPEHPGMHTTDTVDYNVVLSGEIWCELDDGVEVRLAAGDCLVQGGTRHAWRNKGTEPCIVASVMVAAARRTQGAA